MISPPTIEAGNVRFAATFQLAHNTRYHTLHPFGLNRPFAQRDLQRPYQLVAVKRFALAVALDDGEVTQLHTLKRGKARPHAGQNRRRRIAAASSVGRESLTCVSSLPQTDSACLLPP